MNPRASKVIPMESYKLMLVFTNGERGIYDCSELTNFGIFRELNDKNHFKKVKVLDGTVSWPNEQDICPNTLYLDSIKQDASEC